MIKVNGPYHFQPQHAIDNRILQAKRYHTEGHKGHLWGEWGVQVRSVCSSDRGDCRTKEMYIHFN
jgi:hypothetical protein